MITAIDVHCHIHYGPKENLVFNHLSKLMQEGNFYSAYPDAEFFLIKELKKGFLGNLRGSYTDPEGYFVDENEAEEFDKTFLYKEKIKLPGQIF